LALVTDVSILYLQVTTILRNKSISSHQNGLLYDMKETTVEADLKTLVAVRGEAERN
jgi:hypothetical protein